MENLVLNNLDYLIYTLKIELNSIVSASPYYQNKTTKNKGACQIDLLIHTRNDIFYLCEFKNKKQVSIDVISEVKKKKAIFKRPRYSSIKPVLVYHGELLESVIEEDFFAEVIDVGTWLK